MTTNDSTRHMIHALDVLAEIEPAPSDLAVDDGTLAPRLNRTTSDAGTLALKYLRRQRFSHVVEDADDPRNRLRTLHTVVSLVREHEGTLPELVRQARALGASWTEIGQAMGTSKQAAQQRYGTYVDDLDRATAARADLAARPGVQ